MRFCLLLPHPLMSDTVAHIHLHGAAVAVYGSLFPNSKNTDSARGRYLACTTLYNESHSQMLTTNKEGRSGADERKFAP